MDETRAPVLDPGRGQTKKGFFSLQAPSMNDSARSMINWLSSPPSCSWTISPFSFQ